MTERKLTREQLLKIESNLKELERRRKFNKLAYYEPYPKQALFHELGATNTERMFSAANRSGKTFCGSMEVAMHLTGRYPEWWRGRRFDKAVTCWVGGKTQQATRDIPQAMLCGEIENGTGSIPEECVDWKRDITTSRGISDFYDTVLVKHERGGKSVLQFKTYDQGWQKWQGKAVKVMWFDEEPDDFKLYIEGITRLAPVRLGAKSGVSLMTFTPLEGETECVLRFTHPKPNDEGAADRAIVEMSLYEVKHIDEAEIAKMKARYPEYEWDARIYGKPKLGEGRVFPFSEKEIACDAFDIPPQFGKLWGLDFGMGGLTGDHAFAAVLFAWDRDADCMYVTHCLKMNGKLPLDHAAAMKPFGRVPCAWPRDGHVRKDDGGNNLTELRSIYQKHGLRMLSDHAQFVDGSISTEAGIIEMMERFRTNRLKVFRTQREWFQEYVGYHRKDGLIVKRNDDLMSATRVGVMDRRHAAANIRSEQAAGRGHYRALGLDDSLFD